MWNVGLSLQKSQNINDNCYLLIPVLYDIIWKVRMVIKYDMQNDTKCEGVIDKSMHAMMET